MMARADYEQHALASAAEGGPACSSCQLALDLREGGPA